MTSSCKRPPRHLKGVIGELETTEKKGRSCADQLHHARSSCTPGRTSASPTFPRPLSIHRDLRAARRQGHPGAVGSSENDAPCPLTNLNTRLPVLREARIYPFGAVRPTIAFLT